MADLQQETNNLLSRAKAILDGKEKRIPEEAKRLFTVACSSLEEANKNEPKSFPILLLLARCYFERAQASKIHKTEDSKQYEKLVRMALETIEQAVRINDKLDDGYVLWARIYMHLAEYTPSLRENEEYMTIATEKFLKIIKLNSVPQRGVYELLERALDSLVNGTKERERNGKAVYHIAGSFMKQGGGKKSLNWKTRWFVVSDSQICYYKEKKDWENGPVQGSPAQPKGSIEFSEITEVSSHPNFLCPAEKKPKSMDKTLCLHVVTPTRTYNMMGFESKEQTDIWINTIQFALRCYSVKKDAKRWLRDTNKTDLKGESLFNRASQMDEDDLKKK